jgi:hypothetical protein
MSTAYMEGLLRLLRANMVSEMTTEPKIRITATQDEPLFRKSGKRLSGLGNSTRLEFRIFRINSGEVQESYIAGYDAASMGKNFRSFERLCLIHFQRSRQLRKN